MIQFQKKTIILDIHYSNISLELKSHLDVFQNCKIKTILGAEEYIYATQFLSDSNIKDRIKNGNPSGGKTSAKFKEEAETLKSLLEANEAEYFKIVTV